MDPSCPDSIFHERLAPNNWSGSLKTRQRDEAHHDFALEQHKAYRPGSCFDPFPPHSSNLESAIDANGSTRAAIPPQKKQFHQLRPVTSDCCAAQEMTATFKFGKMRNRDFSHIGSVARSHVLGHVALATIDTAGLYVMKKLPPVIKAHISQLDPSLLLVVKPYSRAFFGTVGLIEKSNEDAIQLNLATLHRASS
ncbi:unnamed protein product [Blumeria hordei]|uniref:Uncharacterized protein n=1 Tax=Blumeria hordei TaxID=2867405 RepID=A0A383UUW7_BLUHO|nr:unnamed protein product [Blumeria hordei]